MNMGKCLGSLGCKILTLSFNSDVSRVSTRTIYFYTYAVATSGLPLIVTHSMNPPIHHLLVPAGSLFSGQHVISQSFRGAPSRGDSHEGQCRRLGWVDLFETLVDVPDSQVQIGFGCEKL